MEIMGLNPKLEIRNSKQTRNSKLEVSKGVVLVFGFRICLGFRV
jgi:hypothetical protein